MAPPPAPPSGDTVHVVGAAILRGARCLVVQRGAAMSTPLKWEFPGGKLEDGEGPEAALRREIREELDLTIEVGEYLGRGTARAEGRAIVLDVYRARILDGELHLREHRQARWLSAGELEPGALDWAAADVPVLSAVRRAMRATEAEA
ncbi:MAG: (deoxy)nucleoside triphosphate pyrophosphohydrolase [Acidobacteria bacterium]|nr:(deoxy)nucleoside triphosphate pyrophosphohydrolase [Acidobacteriota bacterium]